MVVIHPAAKAAGILTTRQLKESDERKNILMYTLDEDTSYSVKSTKKVCYEDLGALCGIGEAITDRFFSGVETKCHCTGDSICEFELHLTKKLNFDGIYSL